MNSTSSTALFIRTRIHRERRISIFVFVISVWVAFTLLTPSTSRADSFTVSPPKSEVEVDAGGSATGTLRVMTKGAGESFEISSGTGRQDRLGAYLFTDGDPKDASNTANWIKVSPKSFVSGPGATEPVSWTVTVPDDMDPGDYIGGIFITQKKKPVEGQVIIQPRIAVRLEIRVNGDMQFDLRIKKFTAPKVSSGQAIPLAVVLENKGNIRADLREAKHARLQLKKGGAVVQEFSFVPKNKLDPVVLFPGSKRAFEFDWKKPPKVGNVTAQVDIVFDEYDSRTKAERKIKILPYRQFGAYAVAGFGALLLLSFFLLRALKKRKKKKSS